MPVIERKPVMTFEINGASIYAARLPGRKSWALVKQTPGVLTTLAYFRGEEDALTFLDWIDKAVTGRRA